MRYVIIGYALTYGTLGLYVWSLAVRLRNARAKAGDLS